MGVDDSPSLPSYAPQCGEGQLTFTQLTVGQARPCRDQVRRQPKDVVEHLIDRLAEVLVDPGRLAVLLPLTLPFSKRIPAPDDFAFDDEGQCRIP